MFVCLSFIQIYCIIRTHDNTHSTHQPPTTTHQPLTSPQLRKREALFRSSSRRRFEKLLHHNWRFCSFIDRNLEYNYTYFLEMTSPFFTASSYVRKRIYKTKCRMDIQMFIFDKCGGSQPSYNCALTKTISTKNRDIWLTQNYPKKSQIRTAKLRKRRRNTNNSTTSCHNSKFIRVQITNTQCKLQLSCIITDGDEMINLAASSINDGKYDDAIALLTRLL